MMRLEDIQRMPGIEKLARAAAIAAGIWLAAIIVFIIALSSLHGNRARLRETESVVSSAAVIKSYPARIGDESGNALSTVSSVIDTLGLKDRISQMSSGASGLVVQADRLYPEEFTKLVSSFSERGLAVTTAEVRAMEQGGKGRLISVTIAVGGKEQ